jgi:hypothetical protein
VAALEKAGIRAYIGIPNFDLLRDTGLFGPGHFRYDPERNVYERLRLSRRATPALASAQ